MLFTQETLPSVSGDKDHQEKVGAFTILLDIGPSPESLCNEGAGGWSADRLAQGYAHSEHHQLPELRGEPHDHAADGENDDAWVSFIVTSIF